MIKSYTQFNLLECKSFHQHKHTTLALAQHTEWEIYRMCLCNVCNDFICLMNCNGEANNTKKIQSVWLRNCSPIPQCHPAAAIISYYTPLCTMLFSVAINWLLWSNHPNLTHSPSLSLCMCMCMQRQQHNNNSNNVNSIQCNAHFKIWFE